MLLACGVAIVLTQSVYQWTDDDGVEHFTNEPATIPKGAIDVKTVGGQVDVIENLDVGRKQPAAPTSEKAEVIAQISTDEREAQAQRDEQRWRTDFRAARNKVRELEDEIEVDRHQVEDANGLPIRANYACSGWGGVGSYPGGVIVNNGAAVIGTAQLAPGVTVSGSLNNIVTQGPGAVASPCWLGPNVMFDQIKRRLEKNRRALVRAKDDLSDLERRASHAAVPLEWRR